MSPNEGRANVRPLGDRDRSLMQELIDWDIHPTLGMYTMERAGTSVSAQQRMLHTSSTMTTLLVPT